MWSWLWGVAGNLAASVIVAPVAWFWKIRPHFRRVHAHITAQQPREVTRDGG
jgi:hypothetical protein